MRSGSKPLHPDRLLLDLSPNSRDQLVSDLPHDLLNYDPNAFGNELHQLVAQQFDEVLH